MSVQIGIDLGTTNSLIAQFIDGETRLIPNKLGHELTPSVCQRNRRWLDFSRACRS